MQEGLINIVITKVFTDIAMINIATFHPDQDCMDHEF